MLSTFWFSNLKVQLLHRIDLVKCFTKSTCNLHYLFTFKYLIQFERLLAIRIKSPLSATIFVEDKFTPRKLKVSLKNKQDKSLNEWFSFLLSTVKLDAFLKLIKRINKEFHTLFSIYLRWFLSCVFLLLIAIRGTWLK